MSIHDDPTQPSGRVIPLDTKSDRACADIQTATPRSSLRDGFWSAYIPGVPDTEAHGITQEAAIAGAWRRAAIRIDLERRRHRRTLDHLAALAGES